MIALDASCGCLRSHYCWFHRTYAFHHGSSCCMDRLCGSCCNQICLRRTERVRAARFVWLRMPSNINCSASKEAKDTWVLNQECWREFYHHRNKLLGLERRFGQDPSSSQRAVLLLFKAFLNDKYRECRISETRAVQLETHQQALEVFFERLWVPMICNKIFSTLPREVRDLIWKELHSSSRHLPLYDPKKFCIPEPGGLKPDSSGRDVFDRAWFNDYLVGSAVAKEVTEVWYKYVQFHSPAFVAIKMDDFFSQDRWGFGIQPSRLIREIKVIFLESDIVEPSTLKNLSALRCLRGRARLCLSIVADD